jgi:hypothetical protein
MAFVAAFPGPTDKGSGDQRKHSAKLAHCERRADVSFKISHPRDSVEAFAP